MKKTTVFNLLIIDESGSMSPTIKQTISGCNETLNVIRHLQSQYEDSQRQLASIFLFQSGTVPSRYIFKNKPISDVADISEKEYCPMGCTPLLDAIGSTMIDLEAVAETHEDSTGTVTIITDGMENSSTQYTWKQVASIIDRFKERGWAVNFIGANIDVNEVASRIHVDSSNACAFSSDQQGTAAMWNDFGASMGGFHSSRIEAEKSLDLSDGSPEAQEELKRVRRKASKGFFSKKR